MKKHSVKSIVLATLTALLLSAIQPSLFMTTMFICIAPIMISVLHAWGGVIPSAVLAAGTVGSLAWFAAQSGAVSPMLAALGALIVLVVPGLASVYMAEKKLPFFRRLLSAVGIQTAALLGCAAYISAGLNIDLVEAIISFFRTTVELSPVSMRMEMLQYFSVYGMLTEESIEALTTGIVTNSDMTRVFDQVFDQMTYVFRQMMLGMLMFSGMMSGILMTSLSSRIPYSRGDEDAAPHVPLHEWHLPSHLVGGMAVCYLAGFVLQLMKVDEALAVTAVVNLLSGTLLIIQGMAAILRRFREVGAGKVARVCLIGGSLLFANTFLQIAGILSALFGRKGAISGWMRRRAEEMENDDRKDDE